jgi:hypothetical protein
MGKIALLPCDCLSRAIYLGNRELPDNYMADFSLMGFVVGQYPEAVALLVSAGYRVEEQQGGADIRIDTPARLREIKAFLTTNNISCDLSDIADTLYQA